MEWKTYKMSELIDEISMGPFGSDVKKEFYVDKGFPILNGSNLQGFKLNEDSFGYVTKEKANSLKKSIAKRGDIIVTHRGTLGQIVYVPSDSKYEGYLISQSQFRFRCNDLALPEYIAYYFHTPIGQYKILSNASQVGVPALARASTTFRQLDITIPDIDTQRRIASILSSLDRKIELNNQINKQLEEMAQAIFKSWFIDFEPFKDGEFVESELGRIPKGWRVGTLSEICSFSKRKISVASLDRNTYYSTENMLPNKAGAVEAASLPETVLTIGCMPFDVLVSNIRPYFKKILRVNAPCGCSADVLCFHPNGSKYHTFLYRTLYDDSFFAYVMAGAKGTKMPRGDKQQIMKYQIVIPSDSVLQDYACILEPSLEKISSLKAENSHLSSLRDTLLPKLMSGEINLEQYGNQ